MSGEVDVGGYHDDDDIEEDDDEYDEVRIRNTKSGDFLEFGTEKLGTWPPLGIAPWCGLGAYHLV
jgi:hypothetical protein